MPILRTKRSRSRGLPDVIRLGCHRNGLQPGERGHTGRWVRDEQVVDLRELVLADTVEQCLRCSLTGPRPTGNAGTLDRRDRRQQNAGTPQGIDHARGDDYSLVG